MIESGGRQLWLEVRRNDYRWLFLIVAIGTGFALTDRMGASVVFWSDFTLAWRDALYVLGPWTAAAAAWTAGRERRNGLDDLLFTTARSPFRRRFWSMIAVALLGLLAFGLIGGWLALAGIARIDWAHPDWGVIVIGAMAIVAAALFGFALGAWKPRRATAIGALIALLVLQLILAASKGWSGFLTPTPPVTISAWRGTSPSLTGEQFFLFAGLIALGVTLVALLSDRSWLIRISLTASALVIVVSIVTLIGQDDAIRAEAAADSGLDAPAAGSYTMLCSDGVTIVCVHPAFRPMLIDASTQVNGLIDALGRPAGSPMRIDLVPALGATDAPGTWSHLLRPEDPDADLQRALHDLARTLIAPGSVASGDATKQSVLAWALRTVGRPVTCEEGEANDAGLIISPVSCGAIDRLEAMDPANRTAWLTTNWTGIQAGTIILADFP